MQDAYVLVVGCWGVVAWGLYWVGTQRGPGCGVGVWLRLRRAYGSRKILLNAVPAPFPLGKIEFSDVKGGSKDVLRITTGSFTVGGLAARARVPPSLS